MEADSASRVTSSSVGPRPPLSRMISEFEAARRMVADKRSRSSPTTYLVTTSTPRLLSWSVKYREFVSTRAGVNISEPTAIISAFMPRLKLPSLNSNVDAEYGVGGGDGESFRGGEGQADDA